MITKYSKYLKQNEADDNSDFDYFDDYEETKPTLPKKSSPTKKNLWNFKGFMEPEDPDQLELDLGIENPRKIKAAELKKMVDDKAKKEKEVRQPTHVDTGDYVEVVDFEDLKEDQLEFLKSAPNFYVRDIVNSKSYPYEVGEPYVNIGFRSPFKMSRFKVIDKSHCKYKILFLNFDLPVDIHGEKDVNNFFRDSKTMSELFNKLFAEKEDDILVSFNMYDDIYRIKYDYYINGICLKDYDFVFFGLISNFTSIAKMLIDYLQKQKIPFLKYGTFKEYDNKAFELHLLDSLGYPYIPSIMVTKLTKKIIDIVQNDFEFPVIVKDVNTNRGEGVYKIDDMEGLLKTFRRNSRLMLIQKHIPNDGDFRVITIKRKVELVIKKKRISKTEFRANVARGGKAIKGSLPPHILKMCEDISKHLDSDIIGFDIIQDMTNGEYYVMETNAGPHFPTFSVISGVNIPEIIVNYIMRLIEK
jgi:glutathione synthase/RimK-type ligase-like ATP-grasp enzyme